MGPLGSAWRPRAAAPPPLAPGAPAALDGARHIRDVWAWNFDEEFAALVHVAVQYCAGDAGALLALDMEFPGFVCDTQRSLAPGACYRALCANVGLLWPIQVGIAIADGEGNLYGVWNFNLRFDPAVDLHSKPSIDFLRQAGVDFDRHRSEGVLAADLGRKLAGSSLVGTAGLSPYWLTFSGLYDWGYLLKLLTAGQPLPREQGAFEDALSSRCPRRGDLRELLPTGSLESLGRSHGVVRCGRPHTAGSDALLTLELYLRVLEPSSASGHRALAKRWDPEDWSGASEVTRWWDDQFSWGDEWLSHRWPLAIWQYHAAAAAASALGRPWGPAFFPPA